MQISWREALCLRSFKSKERPAPPPFDRWTFGKGFQELEAVEINATSLKEIQSDSYPFHFKVENFGSPK
jgi:hypothetical protein